MRPDTAYRAPNEDKKKKGRKLRRANNRKYAEQAQTGRGILVILCVGQTRRDERDAGANRLHITASIPRPPSSHRRLEARGTASSDRSCLPRTDRRRRVVVCAHLIKTIKTCPPGCAPGALACSCPPPPKTPLPFPLPLQSSLTFLHLGPSVRRTCGCGCLLLSPLPSIHPFILRPVHPLRQLGERARSNDTCELAGRLARLAWLESSSCETMHMKGTCANANARPLARTQPGAARSCLCRPAAACQTCERQGSMEKKRKRQDEARPDGRAWASKRDRSHV